MNTLLLSNFAFFGFAVYFFPNWAHRITIFTVIKGAIVSTTKESIGSFNRGNETQDINNEITFCIIIILLFIYLTLFLKLFFFTAAIIHLYDEYLFYSLFCGDDFGGVKFSNCAFLFWQFIFTQLGTSC